VETIYYQQNGTHTRQQERWQEAGHALAQAREGEEEGEGEEVEREEEERGGPKMRLAMPRSFTDHPLSRKAQPPFPLLVVLKHHMASDLVAMLDFAGNICDLACVRAGWGIM
jgi:hypothetical protein